MLRAPHDHLLSRFAKQVLLQSLPKMSVVSWNFRHFAIHLKAFLDNVQTSIKKLSTTSSFSTTCPELGVAESRCLVTKVAVWSPKVALKRR